MIYDNLNSIIHYTYRDYRFLHDSVHSTRGVFFVLASFTGVTESWIGVHVLGPLVPLPMNHCGAVHVFSSILGLEKSVVFFLLVDELGGWVGGWVVLFFRNDFVVLESSGVGNGFFEDWPWQQQWFLPRQCHLEGFTGIPHIYSIIV